MQRLLGFLDVTLFFFVIDLPVVDTHNVVMIIVQVARSRATAVHPGNLTYLYMDESMIYDTDETTQT